VKRGKLEADERQAAFLRDIVIEGDDVESFTKGMNLATFVADRMARKAVTKCLESIAEASKHLDPTLKARHPEIPWRQIAGFRDVSAHHYWEIDYSLVWDVVRSHLPQLLAAVKGELRKRVLKSRA
jgi:uncharacterized protein with HEPN domain